MNRIAKSALVIGALGAAGVGGILGYALYKGPRMKEQPHLRTWQWEMPLPPEGAVPVGKPALVPAEATVKAPLPAPPSLESGKVYYGYYCLSCHGEDGRGRGPVGESFVPSPADLTVVRMTPASLHVAMLTGTGHAPVMERVVRPEYRWDLQAYVESLRK